MRQNERDKRNYIIGGLLVLVLFMTIGFAAFRTALNINGTASITSNWCVGFDNRNTETYQITKGVSAGTNPTGEISFSGTACSTNYVPNSTLTANFYQPGDKIEYTLTIANKSSMSAAIESIEVNDSSVTSNQTITDGNIIWKVYMPESTTLASNATTTMKVSAEFQNTTDISNLTTGGSSSLTVGINVVQDDGNGGFTPTASVQTVYAYHTDVRTIGTSTVTDGVSDYTELSSWSNGKTWFLKYELDESNVIQNAWACQKFSFINEPVCLQGGDASYYASNRGIIEGLATTFTSNGGFCGSDSSSGTCYVGPLGAGSSSNDGAGAFNSQANESCSISNYGGVNCE